MTLLTQLGAVCTDCSTWTAPGVANCSGCGRDLPVVAWLHGGQSAPQAAERPASHAVHRQPPSPPPPPPETSYLPSPEATPVEELDIPLDSLLEAPPASRSAPCAGCGRELTEALRFCPTCGTRRASAPTTPVPRPSGPRLEPGRLRLLLLRGAGPSASTFPLAARETSLGSGDCTLRFADDRSMPARAATLRFHDGRLFIEDEAQGSVYVRVRSPVELAPGGAFCIGDEFLRFTGRLDPARPVRARPAVFGSALPATPAIRLERFHPGGLVGAAWVRPAPFRLGRTTGDVRFPSDPFVSSQHCELDLTEGGKALLRDLGSSNGTFVQLQPGGEQELVPGDTFRIGRNVLRVETTE